MISGPSSITGASFRRSDAKCGGCERSAGQPGDQPLMINVTGSHGLYGWNRMVLATLPSARINGGKETCSVVR